jgi:hypothetical protein
MVTRERADAREAIRGALTMVRPQAAARRVALTAPGGNGAGRGADSDAEGGAADETGGTEAGSYA